MANRLVVRLFSEVDGSINPKVLGGKASSLVAMSQMGLPVPAGFVINTGVSRAYTQHDLLPKRVEWQLQRAMRTLESQTGKQFGGVKNPLLLSVRSGAPVSMPGMMDTILNLGISEKTFPALCRLYGMQFASDCSLRLSESFRKIVGCEPPEDIWEQVKLAVTAVCKSWQNPRAIEYRKTYGIPDSLGTAVTVQSMVFGNSLNGFSGSGVLFSRNVATGYPELYGEFLPNSQGEDVVSGTVTPLPLAELARLNPKIFRELAGWAGVLENYYRDVVDIEYTIESDKLYILQCRPAKRTPIAAARFAVQSVHEKRAAKNVVLKLSASEVETLGRPQFNSDALVKAEADGGLLAKGLPAALGAATGIAVFSSNRAKALKESGEKVILFRPDTNPDDLPGLLAASAVVTATGGATSHAAVVALSLGIPAVVGCSGLTIFDCGAATKDGKSIVEGDRVSVDGSSGLVLSGEVLMSEQSQCKEVETFLRWRKAFETTQFCGPDFSVMNEQVAVNTLLNDFYLSLSMKSSCTGSPIYDEVAKLHEEIKEYTANMFCAYLFVACAGELRHSFHHEMVQRYFPGELKTLSCKYGVHSSKTRRAAQQAAVSVLKAVNSRDSQLEFLRLAVKVFSNGWGSTFGGKKWMVIAQTNLDYLLGNYNSAVFVDRVFDLRHNGGRMFDKHPMFSEETSDGRFITSQLHKKKMSKDTYELKRNLSVIWDKFSPKLIALWNKGNHLGLWTKLQKAA